MVPAASSNRAALGVALTLATGGLLAADLALALRGRTRARRATKPALMPLVAARLFARSGPSRRPLRDHTLAALALSAAGDAILLDESAAAVRRGAVCFGAAQLAYSRGFRAAGSRPTPAAAAPIVLAAGAGVAGCWPRAGALRPSLAGYAPLLATMAVNASGLGAALPGPAAGRIAWGARLFLLSDSLVGAQRFVVGTVRARAALEVPVMVSYVAAQWLIADGAGLATRE